MVITAITLENFKGIKGPCRIELRPLTMLFGANSAGKSTVLQGLQYAREILVNNNFNPDKTEIGGDSVNLGGFPAMVRDHNLDLVISLKLELDLGDEDLPILGEDIFDATLEESEEYQELWNSSEEKLSEVTTAWVKIDIAWSKDESCPFVQRYQTGINGEELATIYVSTATAQPVVESFNPIHPLFKAEDYEQERAEIKKESEEQEESLAVVEAQNNGRKPSAIPLDFVALGAAFLFPQLRPALRMYAGARFAYEGINALAASSADQSEKNEAIEEEFKSVIEWNASNANITLSHGVGKNALPAWDEILPLNIPSDDEEELSSTHTLLNITFLSTLVVGPGAMLAEKMKGMCYLGPIREVPERNNIEVKTPDPARWANGLAAWDALYNQGEELITKTNHWLASDERLDSGYLIELEEFRRINEKGRLMAAIRSGRSLDAYQDELDDLLRQEPEKRLYLIEEAKNIKVLPQDVGVGISQVVPVVVSSIIADESLLAMEQPELHTHPRLQVGMGDLFIQTGTTNGNCFIIETHSEHLMLRIMRRIRETADDALPPGAPSLDPDQVAVYYVEAQGGGTVFNRIRIDEDGRFRDRWPHGFFEERDDEL